MLQKIKFGWIVFFLFPCFLHGQTKAEEIQGLKDAMLADTLKGYPSYVKFLFFKKKIDLGLILPAWLPILHDDSVTVLEGICGPDPRVPQIDPPHIAFEDFPNYHFTHDFNCNVIPDPAYRHILSYAIRDTDTLIRKHVHVEWESGIGAWNKGNPANEVCNEGGSYGFCTVGHTRRETFWNWAALGDWVHLEGLWVWDRGHPPAKAEIHPIRLAAVRRKLPDTLNYQNQTWFATRMDIFASANGSVFYNRMPGMPDWVHQPIMKSKDYRFFCKITLPRPSATATLAYQWITRPGHSFNTQAEIQLTDSGAWINIPWMSKQIHDDAVFAQTLLLYWNENQGKASNYKIYPVELVFEQIKINKKRDFLNRGEWRCFASFGGNWIFVNEFCKTSKVMSQGLGKTRNKSWKMDAHFKIWVPEDSVLHVWTQAWDADGVDRWFGDLAYVSNADTAAFAKKLRKSVLHLPKMALGGCQDDPQGYVSTKLQINQTTLDENTITDSALGSYHQDNCLFSSGIPKNRFNITWKFIKGKAI